VPCKQRHRWKACYLEQGIAFPTQATFIKTERAGQGSMPFFPLAAYVLPVASHVCIFPFPDHLWPHIPVLNYIELLLPLPWLICLLNTFLSARLPSVPLLPILAFVFTPLLLAPFSHSVITTSPLASCLGTSRLRHTWQHLPSLEFSFQCKMDEDSSLSRMYFPSTRSLNRAVTVAVTVAVTTASPAAVSYHCHCLFPPAEVHVTLHTL